MSTTVYACSLMPHGSVRTIYREEAKPKPKPKPKPVAEPENNPRGQSRKEKKSVNSNMLPAGLQQCNSSLRLQLSFAPWYDLP